MMMTVPPGAPDGYYFFIIFMMFVDHVRITYAARRAATVNNITGRNSPKYQHERVIFSRVLIFWGIYVWCSVCNANGAVSDRT